MVVEPSVYYQDMTGGGGLVRATGRGTPTATSDFHFELYPAGTGC